MHDSACRAFWIKACFRAHGRVEEISMRGVLRIIDQFGIHLPSDARWSGMPPQTLGED
jgi:hypothetical protein